MPQNHFIGTFIHRIKNWKKRKKIFVFISVVLFLGLMIPQNLQMPVEGANASDYNKKSFWFYPWGRSVTHKGVDIFGETGTKIKSSTKGIVLRTGENEIAGKYVMVLGPKWPMQPQPWYDLGP